MPDARNRPILSLQPRVALIPVNQDPPSTFRSGNCFRAQEVWVSRAGSVVRAGNEILLANESSHESKIQARTPDACKPKDSLFPETDDGRTEKIVNLAKQIFW